MKIPIVKLRMEIDEEVECLREPLTASGKAAEWIEKTVVRHSSREHVIVVCCDASGQATNIDIAATGSAAYCPCAITEIFKAALLSNASNIVLFHNHPGGKPTPSRADREFTKHVRKAGELLGIGLLDHIIIGGNGAYYSFMEANILDDALEDG